MSTELDLDGVIAMLVSMFDRAHADSAGRVIGVNNEQRARRIQKEAQSFLAEQQGDSTMSQIYDSQTGEYVTRDELDRRSRARKRLAIQRQKDAIAEGTRRAAGTVQSVLSGGRRSVESERLHARGSGLVDVISAFTGDRDAQERVASAASAEQSKARAGGTPWLAETVKESGSERDKLAAMITKSFEPVVRKQAAAGVPTSFADLDAQQQARQSVASIEMLVAQFGQLVDNILATSDGDPLPAIQALLDEMQQRAGSVVKSTWQRRRLQALTRETLHQKNLPV